MIGNGASGVTGSGDILFDEEGTPLYEEREQIFMQDDTGAEVGVLRLTPQSGTEKLKERTEACIQRSSAWGIWKRISR